MPPSKPTPSAPALKLRPGERRVLIFLGDLLAASLAIVIALYIWAEGDPWLNFSFEFIRRTPLWFYLLPLFWLLLLSSLYSEHRAMDWNTTLRGIAVAAIIGLGFYMILYFFTEPKALPRRGVAGFVLAVALLTLLWRLFYIRVFTASRFFRRVLLVGGGETGCIILQIINQIHPPPFILVGICDDDPQKIGSQIEGCPVLTGSDRLLEMIQDQKITDLIVAISGQMRGSMFQALLDAQEAGIEITRMPVAYEELLNRVPIRYLEADWILRAFADQTRVNIFYELSKRLVDLLGGMFGLLLLIALYPFIGLAIILDNGWPIFYTQIRMGKGGRLYRMIKFRTMKRNAEPNGQPLWAEENDVRATRVGRFLRKTHLDEVPQIINVLRGEMSLVGPRAERPELVQYFQQQVPFYRARLLVKPGITGWAQVNQEYAVTVDETIEKLEYDLYYIKHRSLWTDLRVILRTPAMVLGLRGR